MSTAGRWIATTLPSGNEPAGPPLPDGLYARARRAVVNYEFSDPSNVVGDFDPRAPLDGRDMRRFVLAQDPLIGAV